VRLAGARHEQRLPDGSRAGFFLGDGEQQQCVAAAAAAVTNKQRQQQRSNGSSSAAQQGAHLPQRTPSMCIVARSLLTPSH
jgi:hypothetical protein